MHNKKTKILLLLALVSVTVYSLSPYFEINFEESKSDIKIKTILYDFISTQYNIAVGKNMPPERLNELVNAIMESSKIFEISPLLITAIIDTETNFKNIIGPYGEIGYMQIRPTTAKFIIEEYYSLFESLNYTQKEISWIEQRLLVDPRYNILVGTAYLKYLTDSHGDIYKALGWYNGGGNAYYSNKVVYRLNKISINYPLL
ncbi:MAG: transglycosylase SLT domain-containing protein [Defluviitoga tunisiensis]|jgi:soluble lytic murein transglycosylase|uniref:Lytic transglycosylase n=1 Tax=Defluviitoga tunisiensis TaxID=1006576 RepID=A0A0C7NI23_DEFTU|nr:transglycosylase SLT domain-containing protein [Defluviitoga tunisiensis]MDD3600477.1 transglycosylase SLT domain-containing protein [Defluviitoga tunisiensis]MDY0379118.1 transglycosylase SLT domain-containing protein [Defluviitoga tunisiensis]CEP77621.1 lytic transglycosylase [Defluviitoga tunisiensis]HHV00645.1 lytic transglycosylase domain-containing protein [Defluviitoga tunisiensis]HOB55572.1 transglycosylase SLT domain-containing protein [Defluviitoga tunisiensis]